MKVNKLTILITLPLSLICGTILIFSAKYETSFAILSGMFTGLVVSFIVPLVTYFYEKEKLNADTKNNIKSLYINLAFIKKYTGNVLESINTIEVKMLPTKELGSFVNLNDELINNIKAELYDGFCKKSEIAQAYNQLQQFTLKIYNLKNIINDLEIDRLRLEISMKMENHVAVKDYTYAIIVRTAKLHEYQASLLLELENILKMFYGKHWEPIKKIMLEEIDKLVKPKNS